MTLTGALRKREAKAEGSQKALVIAQTVQSSQNFDGGRPMYPLKKSISIAVGLLVLAGVAVVITTGTLGATPNLVPINAAPPTPSIPVNVTNTPLAVTGTVNANVTSIPAITGNVNATLSNASVSINNAASSPVLVRNVDDGQHPFQTDLALTNDPGTWGATTSTCNAPSGATQCQISFDVPAGQRLVVEHVSAYVDGASGQTYQTFIAGNLEEFLVLTKQISYPGIDTFTAAQPMRVYIDSGRVPSPAVIITNSNGGSFFGRVTISGYLVPMS
jgi:hypothetical protein